MALFPNNGVDSTPVSRILAIFDEEHQQIVATCLMCGASASKGASIHDESTELKLTHQMECPLLLIRYEGGRGN